MIYIGCDHGGYPLKLKLIEFLKERGLEFTDLGCGGETVDYPDIAKKVCKEVLSNAGSKGLLVCTSGIGISMTANRFKGIRAALCGDYFSAKYSRLHNDANVLCLGNKTIGEGMAIEVLDVFLNTEFEGGRHAVRVGKIEIQEE